MIRWLLAAVAVVLAAIGGAVAVLPGLLDLNRFRPEIAALASDALGREVRIGGGVSLVMLPELTLTAGDVSFAADGGGMTAAEMRLGVTLGALLAGRIEARELVLRGMELRLPWPWPASALAIRAPSWLGAVSARIERGRVLVGDIVVSDVNATLATAATTGTWQAAGTGVIGGKPWRFSVQLSQPGGDGSSGLDIALDGTGAVQGVGASLSGQVSEGGAFAGRFGVWARDVSTVLPAPAVPFRVEGRVTVAEGLAAADELVGELGGVPVRTAAALRFSPVARLDLAVTASRLDFDAWKLALGKAGAGVALGGLVIGVDISTEAGALWGGMVRGVRAAFEVSSGGVELRELRAMLPGEAKLTAAGRVGVPVAGQVAGFEGFFSLGAANLRTTLGWAMPEVGVPEGVLRRASVAGRVVLGAGTMAVDGGTGLVDETPVAGSFTWRNGPRPGVKAALKLGRVDLSGWTGAGIGAMAGWDADVQLEAQEVVAGGVTLGAVVLEGGAEAGRVAVRRFEAGVGPARVTGAGVLVDGVRVVDGVGSLVVPAEGMRSEVLAGLVPGWLAEVVPPGVSLWRAPVRVDVTGSGTLAGLAGRVVAQIGDLRVEAGPTLDLVQGKWGGSVAARHPGAPRLAESLGVMGTAAWLGDGSFGVVAQVQGDVGKVVVEAFDMTAGALHVTGAGAAAGRRVTGKVDFETLPLPLPYPRATQPFPAVDLGGWEGVVQVRAGQMLLGLSPAVEELRGELAFGGGAVRLEGVTARLAGGVVSGRGAVETGGAAPRVALDLRLEGVAPVGRILDLPLDFEGGRMDGTIALTATGASPGALLATLAGEAKLSVVEGVLDGVAMGGLVEPFEARAVAAALAGGATRFGRMEVEVGFDRGGAVLRKAEMTGPGGRLVGSGSVDLVGGAMEVRLELAPAVADPPVLAVRLTGPWGAPGRVAEVADLIRWRAGHPD